MSEVVVGQKLYRLGADSEIRTHIVKRIGSKYFYTEQGGDDPINKKTLAYNNKNYSQFDYQLYRTEQEIIDLQEVSKLRDQINKFFHWAGGWKTLSLEQLREVSKIINP